jgi:hypothetical protein
MQVLLLIRQTAAIRAGPTVVRMKRWHRTDGQAAATVVDSFGSFRVIYSFPG